MVRSIVSRAAVYSGWSLDRSIGEVVAVHRYDLVLLPHSAQAHDARSSTGALVEVKATQGRSAALREMPSHLIVLQLSEFGEVSWIGSGILSKSTADTAA